MHVSEISISDMKEKITYWIDIAQTTLIDLDSKEVPTVRNFLKNLDSIEESKGL